MKVMPPFALVLGLVSIVPVCAASVLRQPLVLLLLRSSSGVETPSLRAVIIDAEAVALESPDITSLSSSEAAFEDSAIFSLAQHLKADFALSGTYRLLGRQIELQLQWYNVRERKVDDPAAVTVVPEASPLSFSVGAAPFIPVFKASAYIPTVGLSFSAEGEYRLAVGEGFLGIVALSGVDLFYAQKAATANAIAVPVGVGIAYRTATRSLVDFSVTAAGGPCVFVLAVSGSGSSAGIVPFLSSGPHAFGCQAARSNEMSCL